MGPCRIRHDHRLWHFQVHHGQARKFTTNPKPIFLSLTLYKRNDLEEDEEFEDTFVLERETGQVTPEGTFSTPATFEAIPEDLQEQLKAFLKCIKKTQPDAIPDKRKRDQIHQAVLAATLQRLAARYPTGITEDEMQLREGQDGDRARMAIEVRLGEKRLLREAIDAFSSEDVDMTVDEEMGPSKRSKRSD